MWLHNDDDAQHELYSTRTSHGSPHQLPAEPFMSWIECLSGKKLPYSCRESAAFIQIKTFPVVSEQRLRRKRDETDLLWRWGGCLRVSLSPRRPSEGERLRGGCLAPRPMLFTVPLELFCICWGLRGDRLRRGDGEREGEREGVCGAESLLTFRLLSLLERRSTRGAARVLRPGWACWGLLLPELTTAAAGASRKGTEERERERITSLTKGNSQNMLYMIGQECNTWGACC